MYDFTTIIDRHNTGSHKWDAIKRDMGEKGTDDVIALSIADMDFALAPEIREALIEKAHMPLYGYDDATDSYYQSIIDWMENHFSWKIEKDWIRITPGVMNGVVAALNALTNVGDAVIIQRPVYYPFSNTVSNMGRRISNNPLKLINGHYEIDFDDLEAKAADPQCTAMLLCNPHNPTGRVWSQEELRHIGDICRANGVSVISDAIHADFVLDGHKQTMFANLGPEYAAIGIDLTAASKTFNLAGLSCANAIIADPLMRAAFDRGVRQMNEFPTTPFSWGATEAAYTKGEPWLNELRVVLNSNLSMLRDYVSQWDGVELIEPEGTYLAWVNFRALGLTAGELCDFMRNKARVYLDEGSIFGAEGEGFERINLAYPTKQLRMAFESMSKAIQTLR